MIGNKLVNMVPHKAAVVGTRRVPHEEILCTMDIAAYIVPTTIETASPKESLPTKATL